MGIEGILGIGSLQSKRRNQKEIETKIVKVSRGQIMETIKYSKVIKYSLSLP